MRSPRVVGRRDEIRTLLLELDQALIDGPRSVIVLGDAGVGKTSLLGAFVDTLSARELVVLRAAPTPPEASVPWGTLRLLLAGRDPSELPRPVGTAIGAVADVAGAGRSDADDVAFAFARLISDLGSVGGLVVVLDDVQHIDPSSASALSFAIRNAGRTLWLVAHRSGAGASLDVERLLGEGRCTTLELHGLRPSELAALVADVTANPLSLSEVRRLHELTAGNPLHARELARVARRDHGWEQLRLPPSLTVLFANRLADQPADTSEVLAVSALAIQPTVALLRRTCAAIDVETALESAEQTGLVHVVDRTIAFDHALVRQAVLDRLGGIERARIHRRLAAVADQLEVRAWHLGEGTVEPSESVAELLEEAGQMLQRRGAHDQAAALYGRAVSLTSDPASATWFRRRARCAIACGDAGMWERAAAMLDDAIPHVDGDVLVEAVATTLVCTDRLHGLERTRIVAIELLERLADPLARGRVLRTLVRIHQFFDLGLAGVIAEQALREAIDSGDPGEQLSARATLANNRFLLGEPVDVDGLLCEIANVDRVLGGQGARWYLVELLVWSDRHDDARRILDESTEFAQQTGVVSWMSNALEQRQQVEFRAGDWDTAEKLLDELEDLIGAYGARTGILNAAERIALAGVRGCFDEVRALRHLVGDQFESLEGVQQLSLRSACGLAALAERDWITAIADLERAAGAADSIGLVASSPDEFRSDLAEALIHAGRLDDVDRLVDQLMTGAQRSGSDVESVQASRCEGMLLTARGAHREAVEVLGRAAVLADGIPRPFVRGRTLLALGIAQRKAGMRSRARLTLELARREFEQLGAVPWSERVVAEEARLGARERSAGANDLTATERRIAELVAQGRSNREIAAELIVSLRTVESNLTRVYRKLGVRSRTELVALGIQAAQP